MSDAGTLETLTLEQLLAHAGWLRRLAGGLLQDGAAVDDAVQETLVTAWRRSPGDPGEHGTRGLRAWLAVVIRNHIRGQGRQDSRRLRTAASAAAEPAPATRSPEEVVTNLELQRLVAALLLELPEPARQVIYLRFFEELDSPAIGARLGVAAGTVRWRLQAALGELRARLDRQDGEGGQKWRRGLAALAPAAGTAAAAKTTATKTTATTAAKPLVASGSVAGWLVGAVGLGAMAVVGAVGLRAGANQAASHASSAAADTTPSAAATGNGQRQRRLPGLFAAMSGAGDALGPPRAQLKTAPFAELRWLTGDVPEVLVGLSWARLVAIDGVSAADIVAFCKERYPARPGMPPDLMWRKRFSEDLVDVLTAMGHPPRELVTLRLLRAGSTRPETVTAQMTRENRQRLWRANVGGLVGEDGAPARSPVDTWARVSPFTGVAFRGEAMDVQVAGTWYRLVSMAGVPVERLVEVARQRFGERWKTRLAEDPAEVLAAATGNSPGTAVDLTLEVRDGAAAGQRIDRRGVALTGENRRRVKQTWRP
jgi:RNA polymerase sigma factor (sigma-70 family)